MSLRLRHPILIAIVSAPLALAAEPAIAAPASEASAATRAKTAEARPIDEQDRREQLLAAVAASYDSARGGFVARSGVPSESAVELALALGRSGPDELWRSRALSTIAWTRSLMDTMSGGFVTRAPRSTAEGAAFETRTAVNARRLSLLVSAWKADGDERHRKDAARVAGFMDRVLLDGRGGFVSAQVGDRELEPAANGIAIRAWLSYASVYADPRIRDFALKSIERVWGTCFDPLGVLLRRGSMGEVMMWPQLADQVEMGRALIHAWRMCGRDHDLERARGLGQVLLAKFENPEHGGFMTQARPKKDGTIHGAGRDPEENAQAIRFMAELSAATGDRAYHEAGRRAFAAFEKEQRKPGPLAADWALAQRALLDPELPEPVAWRETPRQPETPQVIFRVRHKGAR